MDIQKMLAAAMAQRDDRSEQHLFDFINAWTPDLCVDLIGKLTRPAPCENACESRAFKIEIRQLKAENARLQTIIDEANAQEPDAVVSNNGSVMAKNEFNNLNYFLSLCRDNTPLYAAPIPALKSQSCAECGDNDSGLALYCVKCIDTMQPSTAVAVPEFNGWYCAQCQCGVDPSEVTYHETHTVCGRYITDDEPLTSPRITEQALSASTKP
jgi:hypothetical protein